MLSHVIDCARSLDAGAIHVVYGHGGEQVRAMLAPQSVSCVLQAEQLGTGHAVLQAMPAIADDDLVLVLYGDVPLIRRETLERLIAQAGDKSIGLLSVVLDDPTGYGRIVRDTAGNVVRIVEQKDANRKELAIHEVNTGLMAVPAQHLRRWLGALRNDNAQGEYYLTDVVVAAVKEGLKVKAVIAPTVSEVLGINDKIQLAEVEAAHRRERANELMRAGVTVADPARLDVRGKVVAGSDVYLDINVVLVGNVRLGNRVKIGPNCYIRDAEIGDDTEVFPNCVIDTAIIGPGCEIGPFARLRPQTELQRDVHIGNFVEVKKTRVGAGSKANHLTYLGDATIGEKVNVGAGTVTCNYDGANKWPTVIGDGAFIGSGTMLVAPVQVGANATIGAGSTVSREVPADKLTVARNRQVAVEGWKRPVRKSKPET
jgi:bifunctional UDP-N-acetylglucosamine pyrophosphorylase/glucosamine-1-phosphate N-acetyltransferase